MPKTIRIEITVDTNTNPPTWMFTASHPTAKRLDRIEWFCRARNWKIVFKNNNQTPFEDSIGEPLMAVSGPASGPGGAQGADVSMSVQGNDIFPYRGKVKVEGVVILSPDPDIVIDEDPNPENPPFRYRRRKRRAGPAKGRAAPKKKSARRKMR